MLESGNIVSSNRPRGENLEFDFCGCCYMTWGKSSHNPPWSVCMEIPLVSLSNNTVIPILGFTYWVEVIFKG
jgi:hypothetical protein